MREMASTIKTDVLAELYATSKRLHQIASDLIVCNTLTSQVSSHRSTFRAKVKSRTSCRKQQQAENGVSMACAKFLSAMKVNQTLMCERESLPISCRYVRILPRKHWVCGWKTWSKCLEAAFSPKRTWRPRGLENNPHLTIHISTLFNVIIPTGSGNSGWKVKSSKTWNNSPPMSCKCVAKNTNVVVLGKRAWTVCFEVCDAGASWWQWQLFT